MAVILEIIIGLLNSIPSKKSKSIKRRIVALKKNDQTAQLINKYGNSMFLNPSIREFIYKENVELILDEEERIKEFIFKFENVCKGENI